MPYVELVTTFDAHDGTGATPRDAVDLLSLRYPSISFTLISETSDSGGWPVIALVGSRDDLSRAIVEHWGFTMQEAAEYV